VLRLLLTILAATALVAQEALPFKLEYERGDLGLDAGRRNELSGNVRARYGGLILSGETMTWVLSPVVEGGQLWIETLELTPAEGGRVAIDSTEAQIPDLGFRGRIEASRLTAVREATDPVAPKRLRWTVSLDDPGYFAGTLLYEGAWVPHAGWAHRIVIDLVADEGGDQGMRCRSIHFHGRPAADGQPARRCRMDRLKAALPSPAALADHDPQTSDFAMESGSISIHFDEAGAFAHLTPSGATTMYHTPPKGLRLRSRTGLDAIPDGG